LGAALDRAFLGIAARGTARWFLERAVEMVSAGAPEVEPSGQPSTDSAQPVGISRGVTN
jgi:hypothetical protein